MIVPSKKTVFHSPLSCFNSSAGFLIPAILFVVGASIAFSLVRSLSGRIFSLIYWLADEPHNS